MADTPLAGTPSADTASRFRGFTLLELLVVLVLMALLTSLVTINATPDPRQQLAEQASRIGLLMQMAADESRIRQQPLAWEADLGGYRFVSEAGGDRQLLGEDDLLHERSWQHPLTRLAIVRDGQTRMLVSPDAPALSVPIGREWVQPRWRIELADGSASVAVEFDENGIGSLAAR